MSASQLPAKSEVVLARILESSAFVIVVGTLSSKMLKHVKEYIMTSVAVMLHLNQALFINVKVD